MAAFKFFTFVTGLYNSFFPNSQQNTFFILTNLEKSRSFDSPVIKVEDLMYEPSLIESFLETNIVKSILYEYKIEGLQYFKCLILLRTLSPNTPVLTLKFTRIYTSND